MFIVGLFSWWYGAGWRQRASMVRERVESSIDYFSIGLLLRTYFSPFRQISAGRVDGPLAVKLQAFFDKLISRIVGAIVRTVIIFVGIIAISLRTLVGVVILGFWAIVPLFPLIGLVLAVVGWTPRWM